MTTTGNRIKSLRNRIGLTQKDFAEKINVTQSYLSKVEKDKTEPTEKVLKLISFTFNCSLNWLEGVEGAEIYDGIDILDNPDLVSDISDARLDSFISTYKDEESVYAQRTLAHMLSIIREIYNNYRYDVVLQANILIELESYIEKFQSLINVLSDENQSKFEVAKIMSDYSWELVNNMCKALNKS